MMKHLSLFAVLAFVLTGCVSTLPDVPLGHPAHADSAAGKQFEPSGLLNSENPPVMDPLLPANSAGHLPMEGHAAAPGSPEEIYTCPMHPEIVQAGPGKCPKCGMDLVPQVSKATNETTPAAQQQESNAAPAGISKDNALAVYTCPMHPEVQQPGPGKCPKCHMDLVPKQD